MVLALAIGECFERKWEENRLRVENNFNDCIVVTDIVNGQFVRIWEKHFLIVESLADIYNSFLHSPFENIVKESGKFQGHGTLGSFAV